MRIQLEKNRLVSELQTILRDLLEDEPVIAAYLYGSQATGLATRFSDIDIALLDERKLSLEEQFQVELRIQEGIYHACGLENLDIRFLTTQSLLFQGRVLTDCIRLYCRDQKTRVAYETRIRDLYFDFLPVAKRYGKSFLKRLRQEGLMHARSYRN